MLTIGEFSNICKVSAKTLRYYAEIGLIHPEEIDPENGYRYYSIDQLETMLFINRLKSYDFSLEEIKTIQNTEGLRDEALCLALMKKEKEIPAWEELSPDDRMKYEIAEELGLLEKVRTNGWRSLSAKETGRIGGLMTKKKRILAKAESGKA